MSTISDITRLAQRRFEQDVFAMQTTGIVIEEVDDLFARCSLASNCSHQNARGVVMGGVIYTIADFAFAIAANSRCVADNKPFEWISLSADVHYLSAAPLGNIEACCRCLHFGGRTAVFETLVSDMDHHVFAKVTTTGIKI